MIRPAPGRDWGIELVGCDPFDFQGLEAKSLQTDWVLAGRVEIGLSGFDFMADIFVGRHGNVNVFEDLARGDAEDTIGGLDQIVAFATAVLAAEVIGEAEAGTELLSLDQKTGAIGLPFHYFHVVIRWLRLSATDAPPRLPCGTARLAEIL